MNRKKFLASAAAAAAAAAAPRAAPAQFAQQVTIGINAPLSGDLARAGAQLANGANAAVLENNQTFGPIGVGGTGFAVRVFDDLGSLAQAIANIRFGSSDSTIVAMIGGVQGALLTQTVPQYANVSMPLLVAASTADSITARGYRNVWRLPTKDSTEGALFARYLVRKRRPKTPIAVAQDGDYGSDVARGFTDQAGTAGIASQTYTFPSEKPDYDAAARALLSKKPDYLYLCGTSSRLGPIAPALRGAGYAGGFGASEGFYNQLTADNYASALEGALVSTSFPPLGQIPDASTKLSDFRARTAVTALSAFAYAAAEIIMQASRRVGATNRLAMMTALRAPIGYETIVGPFQFNAFGDPIDPILYFYALSGGKFTYVGASHPAPFLL